MTTAADRSRAPRELLGAYREELSAVLRRYRAANPRPFGSFARRDTGPDIDIDILVDLDPHHANSRLLRLSGVSAVFEAVLHREVDVVAVGMLREKVSATAIADAVPR